jgi:hypothetical protein
MGGGIGSLTIEITTGEVMKGVVADAGVHGPSGWSSSS